MTAAAHMGPATTCGFGSCIPKLLGLDRNRIKMPGSWLGMTAWYVIWLQDPAEVNVDLRSRRKHQDEQESFRLTAFMVACHSYASEDLRRGLKPNLRPKSGE